MQVNTLKTRSSQIKPGYSMVSSFEDEVRDSISALLESCSIPFIVIDACDVHEDRNRAIESAHFYFNLFILADTREEAIETWLSVSAS